MTPNPPFRPRPCPHCGRVLNSRLYAELHRRTFHATPGEAFADGLAALVEHEAWKLDAQAAEARRKAGQP